jgi:hypothetical protein
MIRLQKTTPEDITVVMEMENHADNREFVTQNTMERHLAIIAGTGEEHLSVMDENNKVIGYVILVGLENPNKAIELRRTGDCRKRQRIWKRNPSAHQKILF